MPRAFWDYGIMRPHYDKTMDGEYENRISEIIPETTISPYLDGSNSAVPKVGYSIPVGNYLAMDKDKTWHQYKVIPKTDKDSWYGGYVDSSGDMKTSPWADWTDSLFLMTKKGLVKV